jgi:DNA-directed RNA polymerase specialized sigma24 family protein
VWRHLSSTGEAARKDEYQATQARSLRPSYFPGMDRNTAIDRLPEAYAAALRLQDEGHDDNAIAARLDLTPAAVGPLLRVATAKLHTILAAGEEGT